MAEYRMSLTRTETAGEAIQTRRDEMVEAVVSANPDGGLTAFDLSNDETIMRAASKWADGVEPTLIAMGKKLGLKPRGGRDGKGDLEYGIGGSDRHPVEFWAQKVFA